MKFIFLISVVSLYGFLTLNKILKIKSLIFLIPLSVSLGISSFLFITHVLAFLVGPSTANIYAIIILLIFSILILGLNYKNKFNIEIELNKKQNIILILISLLICTATYLSIFRFGTFDRKSHIPISLTMFHNNIYPPRDPYRADYVLLYHFGGDLLAGSVYNLCKTDISSAYEYVATTLSGVTFLSFFALAWILTTNFGASLLAAFCTYFGGGFLFIDAILKFINKDFPPGEGSWTFLQTLINLGVHGGITNAPSVTAFISTFNLGTPLTLLCFILFWFLINEKKSFKTSLIYTSFLVSILFIIYLTTDWLFVTFWVSVLPLIFIYTFIKKDFYLLVPTGLTLFSSVFLNKTIGNALFLQDSLQNIGRLNIYGIGIKEKLFNIVSWGRLSGAAGRYYDLSAFSWDFISEFGISLFLFPLVIFYVIKSKNFFAYLLFFSIAFTMPVPLIVDFKMNPVELNRLFAFGNSMIFLLISCGLATLFKSFLKNKILIFLFIFLVTTSPICQVLTSIIFTPTALSNRYFTQNIFLSLREVKSFNQLKEFFLEYNKHTVVFKNSDFESFKNEIKFLKANGKPGDVAIADLFQVPVYSGVYSIVRPKNYVFWDQLYSENNKTYGTVLQTLDPYLLNELNIKWILLSEQTKRSLLDETKLLFQDPSIFKLSYTEDLNNIINQRIEIYHVESLEEYLKNNKRKTAWALFKRDGNPLELTSLNENKVTLFSSKNAALVYLKSILKLRKDLKNELVTAEPIHIGQTENQIKQLNLPITLNKNF